MYNRIPLYALLLAFALISCRSKHLAVSKSNARQTETHDSILKSKNLDFSKFKKDLQYSKSFDLQEVLNSLNIGFAGKGKDDKLEVEVSRTDHGTKLSVQGTGTANYKEENNRRYRQLELYLTQRQDSLHRVEMAAIAKVKSDLKSKSKTKDKEVKVKGFSAGFYIVIALIAVVLIVVQYIFKTFLKK